MSSPICSEATGIADAGTAMLLATCSVASRSRCADARCVATFEMTADIHGRAVRDEKIGVLRKVAIGRTLASPIELNTARANGAFVEVLASQAGNQWW